MVAKEVDSGEGARSGESGRARRRGRTATPGVVGRVERRQDSTTAETEEIPEEEQRSRDVGKTEQLEVQEANGRQALRTSAATPLRAAASGKSFGNLT